MVTVTSLLGYWDALQRLLCYSKLLVLSVLHLLRFASFINKRIFYTMNNGHLVSISMIRIAFKPQ